jgi:hypothetical protein
MVQKKDGSWRPCPIHHHLNLPIVVDSYPLPNIVDLLPVWKVLPFSTSWTKGLVQGYLQVPVAGAYIAKTAIITPF